MKRIKLIAWVIAIFALAAGALTLLIPAPTTGDPAAFHASLLEAVITTVAQLGAALLFVWGLKGFKHELRIAYGTICAGIVLLGFSNLQLPIVAYFDLGGTFYVQGGIITIPYIVPTLLVFFGVQRFAKLFQLKTIWMSFWFTMGLGVVCAAIAAGLGLVFAPPGGTELIASIAISAWTAIFLLASTFIVLSSKRAAGPLYQDALRWFAAARVVVTLTGFSYTGLLIFFGDQTFISRYGGVFIPSAIAAFLFLRSGYAFKLINEDQAAIATDATVSMIDVVTFAASQASNPSEIDVTLDTLRKITSSLSAGTRKLAPDQKEMLRQTYIDIEQYLVQKEPLRRLSTEEIRRKSARYFNMEYNSFVAMVSPTRDTASH